MIVMGCGRVGSTVAEELDHLGHTVSVIDQDPTAFRRLHAGFSGKTVTGVGFDRDCLIEAGIEQADGFIAVSSGDNSNILAARVAREAFGVSLVVARIYDPRRAAVYERLGIPTVATVPWTTDQILRRILPASAVSAWKDPSGGVTLAQLQIHPTWIGRTVGSIQDTTGARIAVISRLGQGFVPERTAMLQDGDIVHALVPTEKLSEMTAIFAGEAVVE